MPELRREFAKRNQHSCLAHTVEDHFRGKDLQLRITYEVLVSKLREFGPLRIDAVKTSINFISKHHFGGMRVQKQSLRLGFISDEKIEMKE